MSSYRKFTFAISSPDEFLVLHCNANLLLKILQHGGDNPRSKFWGTCPPPSPPRDLRPWAKSGKGYSANIIGVSSATYPRSDSYRDTSRELDSEVGYFIVNSYSYTSTRRPRQRQLSSRQENCLTSTVSQDEHDTASCSSSTRQPMLALIGWRTDASVGKTGQCRATGTATSSRWRRPALRRRDPCLCRLHIPPLISKFLPRNFEGEWPLDATPVRQLESVQCNQGRINHLGAPYHCQLRRPLHSSFLPFPLLPSAFLFSLLSHPSPLRRPF